MFFDIVPNLLSSLLSLLLPIFASYKALRTSDPALLTPWLMYYVILSLFSLFEYWTYFIISWIPFYAYFRLCLLCYLVLPQTQGAVYIYQTYVHPFLANYEADIEHFISEAHDKARRAGWGYVKMAVEWAQENLLGQKVRKEERAVGMSQGGGGYAKDLLARFNLPSARQGLAAPKGDVYGLLSAAMGQLGGASGGSREAQVESMGRSGALIPEGMNSRKEKMTFLEDKKERLRDLLSALDKEASELRNEEMVEEDVDRRMAEGGAGKSRSGTPFERIERDEAEGKPASGSWMPWSYWGKQSAGGETKETDRGRSSGVDTGS